MLPTFLLYSPKHCTSLDILYFTKLHYNTNSFLIVTSCTSIAIKSFTHCEILGAWMFYNRLCLRPAKWIIPTLCCTSLYWTGMCGKQCEKGLACPPTGLKHGFTRVPFIHQTKTPKYQGPPSLVDDMICEQLLSKNNMIIFCKNLDKNNLRCIVQCRLLKLVVSLNKVYSPLCGL